jgi:ubiquinone biosynthesis protein Coq4
VAETHAYSAEPTRNPFRYALAVWRLIRNDPSETTPEAAIVEIGFARSKLGRRFARWEEVVEALKRHPRTAAALRERRLIGRIELEGLSALPVGSLGRSFFDHCRTRDLDPNLVHVPPDDETGWVLNHLYQTHDIWHVVTGWDNDLPGEVGLGNFYSGQFGSPAFFGFMLALILGNVVWRRAALDPVMEAMALGYQAGRKAEPMFGVHWDELWEVPLDDVRARFGIELPSAASEPSPAQAIQAVG